MSCGKSTFIKNHISRINKPKSGEIFIKGKNIKKIKEKNIAKGSSFPFPQGTSMSKWTNSKRTRFMEDSPHQKFTG